VLLIDAKDEVIRERSQSFLEPEHIARIVDAYDRFTDEPGFATVATLAQIAANDGNLSIPLYVRPA
jgi:type I restriction enzyme M protein